jgi:hypothetical protein
VHNFIPPPQPIQNQVMAKLMTWLVLIGGIWKVHLIIKLMKALHKTITIIQEFYLEFYYYCYFGHHGYYTLNSTLLFRLFQAVGNYFVLFWVRVNPKPHLGLTFLFCFLEVKFIVNWFFNLCFWFP